MIAMKTKKIFILLTLFFIIGASSTQAMVPVAEGENPEVSPQYSEDGEIPVYMYLLGVVVVFCIIAVAYFYKKNK